VNDYVAKGRDAVERGKQAFESARQGAGAPGRDAYGSSRGDFSGTSSGVQS
jgi:hypothetical protein